VLTTRHTSPFEWVEPARCADGAKNPHSLTGTGALRAVTACVDLGGASRRSSGVGLAAVVGGVALAGAALAGALAHVYSKRVVNDQMTAKIPTIVAYCWQGVVTWSLWGAT